MIHAPQMSASTIRLLPQANLAELQGTQEALQHATEEKEFLQAQLQKAPGLGKLSRSLQASFT